MYSANRYFSFLDDNFIMEMCMLQRYVEYKIKLKLKSKDHATNNILHYNS